MNKPSSRVRATNKAAVVQNKQSSSWAHGKNDKRWDNMESARHFCSKGNNWKSVMLGQSATKQIEYIKRMDNMATDKA